MNLIDWILDLFRSEDIAQAFVAAPEQTLRDAGFAGVSAAQLGSVAATAVPGLVLGGGDPIVGLQRAVSNQYGFAPAYDYTPQNNLLSPNFAPETNTDLLSNNDTSLLSPDQSAGANAQQGAFNLGFGDITFGDKTTNTATNGGVVVAGDNKGDIVSGDGAVLGNGNEVNNGDILAGTGSNVAVGHSTVEDNGTTATGNGTVIKDNTGTVLHDVDASGGNGGGASAGSGGGLLGIGLGSSQGGNAGGGGIVINNPTTNSGNSLDTSSHTSADTSAHTNTTVAVDDHADSSVHQTTVTDASTHEDNSLFDTSLASNNSLASDNSLDHSHSLALAGSHVPGF